MRPEQEIACTEAHGFMKYLFTRFASELVQIGGEPPERRAYRIESSAKSLHALMLQWGTAPEVADFTMRAYRDVLFECSRAQVQTGVPVEGSKVLQ